jgi:hypothetical protein
VERWRERDCACCSGKSGLVQRRKKGGGGELGAQAATPSGLIHSSREKHIFGWFDKQGTYVAYRISLARRAPLVPMPQWVDSLMVDKHLAKNDCRYCSRVALVDQSHKIAWKLPKRCNTRVQNSWKIQPASPKCRTSPLASSKSERASNHSDCYYRQCCSRRGGQHKRG